ncbi:Alkyl hydroperoxide reductase subunit F [subsurface metagenome]
MEFILPEETKKIPVDENKTYDVIIIGAGPAGMTAAVYCSRKKLDTLVISKDIGGQVLLTAGIENYMGYQYITGPELIQKFEEQIKQFPVALLIGDEVSYLSKNKKGFVISTNYGKNFKSQTVIIASGKSSRPLNVPGEKKLIGRGVSYCATCDAPLFGNMDVAVIGGGNSALTAVSDLIKYAKKIFLLHRSTFRADPVLIERAKKSDKVDIYLGYIVEKIYGKDRVESIKIYSKDEDTEKILPVSGVFIEIGLIPNSQSVKDIVKLNHLQEIEVDCECKTNIEGIFAAGDVTSVPDKQIIVAAGEGAKAALSAYKYLVTRKK